MGDHGCGALPVNTPLFFESAGDERATPQAFFDALDAEFHFEIDAAAGPLNHKCDLWYGEGGMEYDALEADWGASRVFLNPPYSVAGAFIKKAREEADKGATVVLLLPVRSDTKWWHKYIWNKDGVRTHSTVEKCLGGAPMYGGLETRADGDWRPGVRGRFLPGRLNFELKVPDAMRAKVKADVAARASYQIISEETGLPKMAIDRILADWPDEDLMDAAPFPSCVIIFTKVGS